MNKKILILNDGSQYQNWGIKACIDGLNLIISEQNQGVECIGLSHAYMHQRYTFDPTILGRRLFTDDSRLAKKFLPPFHVLPRIADEFEAVAELWLQGKGGGGAQIFLQRAGEVDAVVFNAEGSTYRDNIGAMKGLFMLWFAKTKLGKKAMFVNGSVTLTSVDAVLPAIIKKTFSSIDVVAVRETVSQVGLSARYSQLTKKVQMFPDSVFALPHANESGLSSMEFLPKDFFVFSLSMLPMDHYRSLEHSSIVHVITELKKIVPHVVLLAKDTEDQVLQEVAQITGATFVGPSYNYDDVMGILKRAKFLFSGRYHHLIFATKVGCPVIPMDTSSHKIHGLANLFKGLMPRPIDPTDLWEESPVIITQAKAILEQGDILRNEYAARAEILREDALRLSSIIQGAL